jgi:hypothetical protein
LDFPCQFGAGVYIAEPESDIRTGVSQRKRNGAPQAASGTGNKGDLAG